MKFNGFNIVKYKAVKNIYIGLKNNLIPIIGINESGKTSVLHAILSFDKLNDSQLNGNHLNAKNRYDYDSEGHAIEADLSFDSTAELEAFLSTFDSKKKKLVRQEVLKTLDKDGFIKIRRDLDTDDLKYSIMNCSIIEKNEPAIEFVLKKMPYILLFDDFTDRVPEKIVFSPNYLEESYDEDNDPSRNDWHSYVEEIFLRATNNYLSDYLDNPKKVDKEGILSDVTDILNQDIIEGWKKLKILSKELQNEKISDLKLTLKEDVDASGNFVFTFNVIDKNFKGKGRFFHVIERSKGFQWFFNFAIKLKYNPKYTDEVDGAIYLLDEPGSYLHSSAQEELLKSLKEISKTNKVIYCTHSQYLLNPDIINVANVRIAGRSDGVVSFKNFNEYAESDGSQGALSPLYDALHMNVAKHDFPRNKKIILTEGISDYYLLQMLRLLPKYKLPTEISIIPGAGAHNLKDLISFCITWSSKYTVIFDSDKAGLAAHKKYSEFFDLQEAGKWITYSSADGQVKDVKLEDLFSSADRKKLKELFKSSSVKKALISLFFLDEIEKRKFLGELDAKSEANLLALCSQINSKLET